MYRYEDDWFLVELMDENKDKENYPGTDIQNAHSFVYYLCDDINGVVEFLKYLMGSYPITKGDGKISNDFPTQVHLD